MTEEFNKEIIMDKDTFIKILEDIVIQEEREERLSKALQDYAEDKNFTGFHTNVADNYVKILESAMNDEYQFISWWLWDSPHAGKNDDPTSYTILITNENGEQTPVSVRTPADLYDFLTGNTKKTKNSTLYSQQTEGFKCAIHTIDKLINQHSPVEKISEMLQSRAEFLLTLRKNLINEYSARTGEDESNFDPPIELNLIKFNP